MLDVADALRHLVKLAAARLPSLNLFALLRELARGGTQVCLCDVQVVLLCFDFCSEVSAEVLDHSGHVYMVTVCEFVGWRFGRRLSPAITS